MTLPHAHRLFFTADLHLLNPNALGHCGRRAPSLEAMHRAIVRGWRDSGVETDDEVFILGDLAMYKSAGRVAELVSILDLLPGRIRILPGNHDRPEALAAIAEHYARTSPQGNERFRVLPALHSLDFQDQGERRQAVLCHYPMMDWPGKQRGALHLFGHCHGHTLGMDRSLDVGLDAHPDGKLWRLDAIVDRLDRRPIDADQRLWVAPSLNKSAVA